MSQIISCRRASKAASARPATASAPQQPQVRSAPPTGVSTRPQGGADRATRPLRTGWTLRCRWRRPAVNLGRRSRGRTTSVGRERRCRQTSIWANASWSSRGILPHQDLSAPVVSGPQVRAGSARRACGRTPGAFRPGTGSAAAPRGRRRQADQLAVVAIQPKTRSTGRSSCSGGTSSRPSTRQVDESTIRAGDRPAEVSILSLEITLTPLPPSLWYIQISDRRDARFDVSSRRART